MLRIALLAAACSLATSAWAGPVGNGPAGAPQQCPNELASVDRSFAEAMRDLQRNGSAGGQCGTWRRQIDVMKKASDVFARCIENEARDTALHQMDGSISDFRAMIDDAKCP